MQLTKVAAAAKQLCAKPNGTESYRTGEVTLGGVIESRSVPGHYFIGEVIDVTGHLGGFNLRWA